MNQLFLQVEAQTPEESVEKTRELIRFLQDAQIEEIEFEQHRKPVERGVASIGEFLNEIIISIADNPDLPQQIATHLTEGFATKTGDLLAVGTVGAFIEK